MNKNKKNAKRDAWNENFTAESKERALLNFLPATAIFSMCKCELICM